MRRLDIVYDKLREVSKDRGISAQELSDILGLSRANVSSDLNRLCEEGRAEKNNGRPVLFRALKNSAYKNETILDRFSRENKSLSLAVDQSKAAILYPPKGLHILILGETGVGKSMFASLVHKYAIEMVKVDKDSPFITFNCADYANNPQLLLSQLFGVKKGAYTGADSDRVGLIEKANGGILFLDEVHRLPAEGQEMFFTFMDQGIFRRLGETESERRASVLLISATTENPESSLLKTFTRRIPMVIRIPGLKERGMQERFNLIGSFFREESSRLDREIKVSINSIRGLLSYDCPNNVGQLKTDIQIICARAYADFLSNRKEQIKINSTDLPSYIREGIYKEVEHRQLWNKLIGVNSRYITFNKNHEDLILQDTNKDEDIYDMIDIRVSELENRGVTGEALEKVMEKDIERYFEKYMYSEGLPNSPSNFIDPYILKVVDEIIEYSNQRLKKAFNQKYYYGLAMHIMSSIERVRKNKKIVNPQLNRIRIQNNEEFNTALECLGLIEREFDISMPVDEAGFLAMFFALEDKVESSSSNNVGVFVVAHGESTATSMVEVANKLLGINYAVGINAPLEEKPQNVLLKLKSIIKNSNPKSGALILVDMGSFTTFGEVVEREFNIPVRTMQLVSTLHVIEAARKAMLGYSLDHIYSDTINVNSLIDREGILYEEKPSSKKYGIVTVCTTGEGSALAIKKFLEGHLVFDRNIMEIIPLNLIGKESIEIRISRITREREIICIVSPFDFKTSIPKFNLEEVLSLRNLDKIQYLIDVQSTYEKMGQTLGNQLKNVNGERLFEDIKAFISKMGEELAAKIDTDVLIGITLHIGCMIDRILENDVGVEYVDRDNFIMNNKELYNLVLNNIESLNEKYKIKISKDEICFIMNFFNPLNYNNV